MNTYSPDAFAGEIAAMRLQDEQDVLAFLPLAARLAALGDRRQLDRWPELVKSFQINATQLLVNRCHEGVWDLRNAIGEDLGLAIVAAQDFECFCKLEQDILPEEITRTISAWVEEAEVTPLDSDAVETLGIFLQRFPIREDLRLNVVEVPLSEFEESILAHQAMARPTQEVRWPDAVAVAATVYALGDSHPSDALQGNFEKELQIETKNYGFVQVIRRLDKDWRVIIDISRDSDEPIEIESMRLGLLPGEMAGPQQTSRWVISLKHFDHGTRLAALRDVLVINFIGYRLRIS